MVVHGSDGLDELTTTGISYVAEVIEGEVRESTVDPAELGLPPAEPQDLVGGDAAQNAAALSAVLAGDPGPYRNIACLNAAGALVVAGVSETLSEGLLLSQKMLDEGLAKNRLDALVSVASAVAPE